MQTVFDAQNTMGPPTMGSAFSYTRTSQLSPPRSSTSSHTPTLFVGRQWTDHGSRHLEECHGLRPGCELQDFFSFGDTGMGRSMAAP